jgi:hypothetical protein
MVSTGTADAGTGWLLPQRENVPFLAHLRGRDALMVVASEVIQSAPTPSEP